MSLVIVCKRASDELNALSSTPSWTRRGFDNLYVLVFGFKSATHKSSISDSVIILCETNNNCEKHEISSL